MLIFDGGTYGGFWPYCTTLKLNNKNLRCDIVHTYIPFVLLCQAGKDIPAFTFDVLLEFKVLKILTVTSPRLNVELTDCIIPVIYMFLSIFFILYLVKFSSEMSRK